MACKPKPKAGADVVSLRGDPIWKGEPQAELVACLEDAIARARCGEIVGVAIAMQYRDGSSGRLAAGNCSHAPMLGALELAKHDILSAAQK